MNMKCEKLMLSDLCQALPDNGAYMVTYIIDESREMPIPPRPAVIIFPGGAYSMTSDREAEPVALNFLSRGYNAFIVRYSCAPVRHPQLLLQAAVAVAHIRSHCDEYHINPSHIAVMGFSAGGHEAAMISVHWNDRIIYETLGIECDRCRPDASILCYPVISSGKYAHRGSIENLLGAKSNDPKMLKYVSIEESAGEHCPPAFIWAPVNDRCVPSENSLILAMKYKQLGIPFELHMFANGAHGISLGDRTTPWGDGEDYYYDWRTKDWARLCDGWMTEMWGLKK